MALPVGAKAPNFTLPSTAGGNFTLHSEFRNKIGIVYFYPKDFSAGCTAEACAFRDAFDMFRGIDVPVIGISADDIETHHKFRTAHNLPFHLLTDVRKTVAKDYDVLAPIVGFIQRVTYLIDENMTIAAVYQNLFDARGHIDEMIKQLRTKSVRA
ncbi:MAG: peroxiredoxin [Candidatus Kapabacteria bacterium]|jgi:peroxiredoxin Q/BCP|nr:peroxiredoxin [Candidatus Kapabacteria bacterium]